MATGDIKAVSIRSDGWSADVTIEGWSGRQGVITYDYDVDGTPNMVFTVVSEGYNATGTLGTVTRTVYGTKTIRLAKPNEATLDETDSGSDLVVRVALSANVYDDDKNGGAGTSGTNPTVTVSAAWATSSSPAETTNAVTALSVTNNSTLDYPVTFGQHDPVAGTLIRSRVKGNFPVAFNARHGEGVACVRWNATGGTSGHTQEAFATVQTATQRTATGLWACAYGATIPIAGFTQAETITVRVRAYPVVGDANSVLDTNGRTTAANEILGWNDLVLTCDKDNLLDVIRYVSTTGNDTTGDGSSGNPWATIGKATTTAGVNIVRLMGNNTTHNLGSTATRRTATEWVIVEPDTGVTGCRVEMTTTRTYRCERLLIRNCEFRLASTTSWLDGEALNFIALDNVTFNKNAIGNPTTNFAYQSLAAYVLNCGGDIGITAWAMGAFSTDRVLWQFDGVSFADSNARTNDFAAWYRCVACELRGSGFATKGATANGPTQAGILFEFNRNLDATSSARNLLLLGAIAITGVSIIGNLFEKTAGTESAVHLWADNTVAACTHVIVAHNTGVGSGSGRRWNIFYNDRGTTPYNHRSVFLYGNHIDEGNIKSDAFGHVAVSITQTAGTATITLNSTGDASNAYAVGQSIFISGAGQANYNGTKTVASSSGAASGGTLTFAVDPGTVTPATGTITVFGLGRVGNWEQLYGVNSRNNNMDTTSGFNWETLGENATQDTPAFANAASNDYGPASGSTLLNRVRTPLYVPFDLLGRRLSVDSTARATGGAVQPAPTMTVTANGASVTSGASVDLGPSTRNLSLVATVGGLTGAVLVVDAGSVAGGISSLVPPTLPRTLTAGGSTTTATFTAALGVSPGTFSIGTDALADHTGTLTWTLIDEGTFRGRMGSTFRTPTGGIRRR